MSSLEGLCTGYGKNIINSNSLKEHKNSYFVQFQDGQQSWRNVPQELEGILQDYRDSPFHVDVIAFDGTDSREYYFVSLTDGNFYHDLPSRLADELYDIDTDGMDVRSKIVRMSLGRYNSCGSYFVEYSFNGKRGPAYKMSALQECLVF